MAGGWLGSPRQVSYSQTSRVLSWQRRQQFLSSSSAWLAGYSTAQKTDAAPTSALRHPHQLLQLPAPKAPPEAPCAATSLGQCACCISWSQP